MGEVKLNRTRYYNYIEEKLNFLAYRIEKRGKINLLDLNIHSETFFAELFNILYNYNLVNLNSIALNLLLTSFEIDINLKLYP